MPAAQVTRRRYQTSDLNDQVKQIAFVVADFSGTAAGCPQQP